MAYLSGCELITRNRCYYPNEKRCLLSGESGLTDSTALQSSHLHAVTFLWRVKLINVSRQPPNMDMDRERVQQKILTMSTYVKDLGSVISFHGSLRQSL